MINFNTFLIEATIKDLMGGAKESETERHRLQYFDDSHPEGTFNKISGRYVLARDRSDLHPDFKKDSELKLDRIALLKDAAGKMRYHGIVGNQAIPMSHFHKPKLLMKRTSDTLKTETAQINSIKSQIDKAMQENGGNPVRIKTADGKVHEVAGIKAVGGKKKADAFLHDAQGNPVHYMSLKGDTYQQWGGYTDVFDHQKMKNVISQFQELKSKLSPDEGTLPAGSIYHYSLDKNDPEDRKIIMRAMYGKDHGGEHGENNVNAIYGGNTVELRKGDDGIHTLHTNALHVNRNDDTSDVTDAKIMLHKSTGHSQAGTGGRITIQHALNAPSSTSINGGIDQAIQARQERKIRQDTGESKPTKPRKARSLQVSTKNIETPPPVEAAPQKQQAAVPTARSHNVMMGGQFD